MNMQIKTIDEDLWRTRLISGADELGMSIDDTQINLLRSFANELLAANQTVNLTRVTDPSEIAEILMLDSLVPGKFIPSGSSVLDLGTGAGFPGIPLKIVYPSLSVSLLDSKRKKINFLKHIIRHLNLNHTVAKQSRAEDVAHISGFSMAFDVVVSRAVTSLDRFVSMAVPFLKKEGSMISMKGSEFYHDPDNETIPDISHIFHKTEVNTKTDIQFFPYRLPASGKKRSLVIIRIFNKSIN
jgi:16S rRNA (guanine527-N7)-methyltransferase